MDAALKEGLAVQKIRRFTVTGPRLCVAATVAVLLLSYPSTLRGQNRSASSFTPTFSVGATFYVADLFEEPGRSIGVALRGGVSSSVMDVAALIEAWPDVRDFRIASLLVEANYVMRRGGRLSPLLLVGVGHSWSTYHGPATSGVGPNGTAASVGFGLRWFMSNSVLGRAETVLRTDDGGYNASLRFLAGWTPAHRDEVGPAGEGEVDIVGYWMSPIRGPWEFVEPGYGLRVTRSVGQLRGGLTLLVFHWQIPGRRIFTNYLWDTRAFVALPSVGWDLRTVPGLVVRGGPSVTIMGEGPGNGASFGGHLEAEYAPDWSAPVGVGLGWFWMRHDTSDSRITGADQHGLTLFAGLHF